MNTRQLKGQQIAQMCRITKTEKGWQVPSQSGHGAYLVAQKYLLSPLECNCPDYEIRGKAHNHEHKCKHIYAVEITLKREIDAQGNVTTTAKVTYSQNWSAYDKAKTKEGSLFVELLNDLCKGIQNPEYKFGRPSLALSDMAFASALKVYSMFSLRRFVADMQFAKNNGYIDKVPCFASVGHFMQREDLTPVLTQLILSSATPLKEVETDFAVDSSGFSTCRFDRWYSFKYGKEINSRTWIKAHLICGTKTNIIASVKLTEAHDNDCPQLPELVETTAKTFQIQEVSADKAYLSRENLEAVTKCGGVPYIPFKSNSTDKAHGFMIWKKMYHYFMFNREEFLTHYHKRSNVETVFHMVKAKFGDSVKSKTQTAQMNEVLLKILCHNICVVIQEMFELGISPNFSA